VIDDALRDRIEAWRSADPDPETRAELAELLGAAARPGGAGDRAGAELRDRFAGRLAFGTSGLRAAVGAGPRRMNRLVVQQTAAGLARWLTHRVDHDGDRTVTVVVGWDARHRSADFALDVARVAAAAGLRALLLPRALPTPVVAFAVRHLGTDAGVMCTASHNPPGDNGCKVYLDDGAQIVAPDDAELAAVIAGLAADGEGGPVPLAPAGHPGVVRLDGTIVDAYVDHVGGLGLAEPEGSGRDLPIVHTALHGVGGELATRLLRRAGFRAVEVVAAQAEPDPAFPTTPYPDPEEPAALDLAVAQARRRGAALVLANDPDADRLGVAVPAAGAGAGASGWRTLSGNEIGALLCEHVLCRTKGSDRLVVTTIVSSRLVGEVTRHHGVHHVEVPTGFKWIVRPARDRPDLRFVFGFEEALGFSVDPYVRDKDGLAAGVAVAGLAAALAAEGRDVEDELERLARRHGHHATRTWSVRLAGPGVEDRRRTVIGRWRQAPPAELAGRRVASVRDLAAGSDGFPPTDAVVVTCDDGARVVLRPSGTEPKVKVYLEVVVPVGPGPSGYDEARRAGAAAVEALRRAVAGDLGLDP
jgi:phosphomannomutase